MQGKIVWPIVLCALLLGFTASVPAGAANLPETAALDLYHSLFPEDPVAASPLLDPGNTCREIYEEISRLEPHSRNTDPGFYDDPISRAIGVSSYFFEPFAYLLALPEAARYQNHRLRQGVRQRMVELRSLAASKSCFVP